MIKHILRIILVLSAVALSVGMVVGSTEYTETGASEMLILSWVGVFLWIPLLVFVVKYLTEKNE